MVNWGTVNCGTVNRGFALFTKRLIAYLELSDQNLFISKSSVRKDEKYRDGSLIVGRFQKEQLLKIFILSN